MKQAEEKLKGMLQAAGLPVKASYRTGEVCDILGIVPRTFWRLVAKCERNERGELVRPDCLDSFMLSDNKRVTYHELVDFLRRNNTYHRQNAVHPDQMALFEAV
jgi:hypothetical protein